MLPPIRITFHKIHYAFVLSKPGMTVKCVWLIKGPMCYQEMSRGVEKSGQIQTQYLSDTCHFIILCCRTTGLLELVLPAGRTNYEVRQTAGHVNTKPIHPHDLWIIIHHRHMCLLHSFIQSGVSPHQPGHALDVHAGLPVRMQCAYQQHDLLRLRSHCRP